MRILTPTRSIFTAILVLALSACGGGGGGSDGSSSSGNAAPDAAAAAITDSNMETVAGVTVSLASADLRTADQAGDAVTGAQLQRASTPALGSVAALAVRALRDVTKLAPLADSASGATLERSEDCDVSGSFDVSLTSDDDNLLTLDPGDSLVLVFRDCDQGDGGITGELSLGIVDFSGDIESTGVAIFSARFTNLRISDGVDSLTANGEMLITLTVTGGVLTANVDSTSMEYTLGVDGDVFEVTVREGSVSFTENAVTGTTVTVSEDFIAIAPGFNGSATITTETSLVIDAADQILSGKLKVAGLDSALFVTFLDAGQVLLELDANDNGLIDVSVVTALADLPVGLP